MLGVCAEHTSSREAVGMLPTTQTRVDSHVQAEPLKPLTRVVVGIHSDADLSALAHASITQASGEPTLKAPPTQKPEIKSPTEKPVAPNIPVEQTVNVRDVFWMTTVMAAACGLGALPFFFIEKLSKGWAALANAVACGVMIAASFDLLHEAESFGAAPLILGLVVGILFIKHMQVRAFPFTNLFHILPDVPEFLSP